MNFNDKLNNYIKIIGCTSKELSDISNISQTVISRYRKGDRIPKYESKQLENLVKGLATLAKEKNIDLKENTIKQEFSAILNTNKIDYETFKNNLNILMNSLKINGTDIAKYMGFDASYISKIRKGDRIPQNLDDFASGVCRYIVKKYQNEESKQTLTSLINCGLEDLNDDKKYYNKLITFISSNTPEENPINNFLKKLDDFDLNEYIQAIHFDDIKIPTMPFDVPKTKNYYGLEEMKKGQIECLKRIVLSKNKEDVFFYSNMPMEDLAKDLDFGKKWMIGLAMILKKGLKLNIVHNVDRPFKEMMLGLESWIPLYMTGQINPYYFKNNENDIYSHLDCIGGSIALTGECITGSHNKGKYYLTNKKDEIKYYKEKAKLLLKKASPLMNIYQEENKKEFNKLFPNDTLGTRRNILSSLPIYTISNDLLEKILTKNKIKNQKLIKDYIEKEKNEIKSILKQNKIIDEITIISKEEFEQNPPALSLSKIFFNKKITYTYEDYLKHIELTKKYKKQNKNYNYKIKSNIFKNINIHIINNKQVIISKENSPAIHFVIHHPKLINAIEKFETPVIEKS